MKVIKAQISGCNGPLIYDLEELAHKPHGMQGLMSEIKEVFLAEGDIGDTYTLTIADMDEEEFENLQEFEGY